ncbi:MAG: transglutaminase family protein [Desulfamplus sp.]|nr:transglutaminase family protein [Desulfamplus sp.]
MSIQVALYHKTNYIYDRKIQLGSQIVRLRPAPHCRTPILSYSQTIKPENHFINWQQDTFSNYLARLNFTEKTDKFSIVVDLVAEMIIINPFDFFLEPYAEKYPFTYQPELAKDLKPFLEAEPPGAKLKEYLASIDRREMNTNDFLVKLNQGLEKTIKYNIRMEPNVQTTEDTLTKLSGSCRDSAWLLVQILRNMGLAARFVSGYLIQLAPDVKSLEGPSGPENDFTDLHAWTEVYLPGAGWIGLDATSGLLAGEGHIPLACTPDPRSAAPITGLLEKCEVEFNHTMRVTRIHEDPRSTKPYPHEIWTEIEALGYRVDEEIKQENITLTMGGEPTFISIKDMEGAEWNTAAVGPTKKIMSVDLLKRLRAKWAPGSLLHFGQGKWYPGESLPRWALSCFWRKDGVPVWRDDNLLADEQKNYGFGPEHALKFMTTMTQNLGVNSEYIMPAYEDIFHWLWKEQRLPINVKPTDSKLKNAEDRSRMALVFEKGVGEVTGYVLPLQKGSWKSGPWYLRSQNLFLIPGDSPMGLRLPLDSLPWVMEKDYPHVVEQDPMGKKEPLPDPLTSEAEKEKIRALAGKQKLKPHKELKSQSYLEGLPEEDVREDVMQQPKPFPESELVAAPKPLPPAVGDSAAWVIRTALCIQPREGRLYIFMPPMEKASDYFELVAEIENTASITSMPVIIEGYTPPFDHRITRFSITPDPGVMEVNIHPSNSWQEMVKTTTELYEEARFAGLGTEKFMLDGHHSGTGGGNHIIMGGQSPAESPWLKRPDLLRSFLTYWNNHPSLSFLFSGLFVGPTSQAPRIDEARHDTLNELEIAFDELDAQTQYYREQIQNYNSNQNYDLNLNPNNNQNQNYKANPNQNSSNLFPCPPWLVDRLFRHLLTDLTGNTHRAEFCIDKLYSPDSATGRLGLVEFRSFEMPPHAFMSLAQQLLLRIFMVRFWKKPYMEKLIQWGTTLHDRFMLPHYVWQDFCYVLMELTHDNYPMKPEYFRPHFEFRFPFVGKVVHAGIEMELRVAIEPWHVLGEEPGGGGTARYVDSSLERMQVLVKNMVDSRHLVMCNGRPLPMQPTGVKGEFVAGVRYRAWQPPSCLHPTIGVHAPLIFDIVDKWSSRSIGGCTYHVAHPGGRSYETFPVNSYEAEGRRVSRFFSIGHTPGIMENIPEKQVNSNFPHTLDLRRR